MTIENRIITLNEVEKRVAQYIAKRRKAVNAPVRTTPLKKGDEHHDVAELEGIGGEIAFCKFLNIYPDLTIGPQHGGADCERGLLIDVKARRREDGMLLVVKSKRINAVDAYALMVGTFPKYRFAGWCRADEVVNPDRLIDLGHGETYAIEQAELTQDFTFPVERSPR